jgi:hypothetical protein
MQLLCEMREKSRFDRLLHDVYLGGHKRPLPPLTNLALKAILALRGAPGKCGALEIASQRGL